MKYILFTLIIMFIGCSSSKEFSFIQVGDTHIGTKSGYPKVDSKLERLVQIANEGDYDFLILTGDIADGGSSKLLKPDMIKVKGILDKLNIPYYPAVGNHETMGREDSTKTYSSVLGFEPNYYFIYDDILFISLNDSGFIEDKGRNNYLRSVLKEFPDIEKIIFCHVPLVNMRDEKALSRSFGFPSYKLDDNSLIDIIRDDSSSILMVLSGHLHLSGWVKDCGIFHIVASGLANYPCQYLIYDVYEDSIEVTVKQIDNNLCNGSQSIHGKPRWSIDYTDKLHKTREEYLSDKFGFAIKRKK